MTADYAKLDAWINAHFDEEVRFLQELVRVPTPTPPGDNAPHAERTADLLREFGFEAEKHPVPQAEVLAYGLESLTNLVRIGLLAAALILLAVAVLLILNTTFTAMMSRRREIEVMKLVGATNSFIRFPFMLEGMLHGLIGGIIAGDPKASSYLPTSLSRFPPAERL